MELIKRNPRTAAREFDGIALVITPDDSMIHKLNETATFIWNAAGEAGISREELVAKMIEEFDVAAGTAAADIDRFVDCVVSKGIFVKSEA